MAICYYVTNHGLGHCVRTIAIINRLPAEIPVILVSNAPREFLDQELRRPVTIRPAGFDCGTIQPDGFTVDPQATLETYNEIHQQNQAQLERECDFLKSHGVRLVASDVPSFPLKVARHAGIPGVLVANFTWACIYEEHVHKLPDYRLLLEEMKGEYRCASKCLRMAFSTPMPWMPNVESIGLVGRQGRNIRRELAQEYTLDPSKRWVLLYLGRWPSSFQWSKLGSIADTHFLVLGDTGPADGPLTRIDAERFAGFDVVASCNAVVAKPGYGIASDCMANDVPLVYTTREGFAEFPPLHADLQKWGRGVCIPADIFMAGELELPLQQAYRSTGSVPFPVDGTARAAARLTQWWQKDQTP